MSADRLTADREELARFIDIGFRYADEGGFVLMRSFEHETDKPILFRSVKLNGSGLGVLAAATAAQATATALHARPAVFAPPFCTFNNDRQAREQDVANGLMLSAELDAHPVRGLIKARQLLGEPTMIVSSGGEWPDPATGELQQKLHIHYRLSEPTRHADEHALLKRGRVAFAVLTDGDTTNGPISHPIRWAGSVHNKDPQRPRHARIIGGDPERDIELADAVEILEAAAKSAGIDPGKLKTRTDRGASRPSDADPRASRDALLAWAAVIPNDKAPWDEWRAMQLRFYAASGGSEDGLDAFMAWSRKCADKHSDDDALAAWDHVSTYPPDRTGFDKLAAMAAKEVELLRGRAPNVAAASISMQPQRPAAPAEDGLPDVPDPLILDPSDPLPSAAEFVVRHHTTPEGRTIHRHRGEFHVYQRSHYRTHPAEGLRSGLYAFLAEAQRWHVSPVTGESKLVPFRPTTAKVSQVIDALVAHTYVADDIDMPAWLDGREHPPARELVAMANGLLHLPSGELFPHSPQLFAGTALPFGYDAAAPSPDAWLAFLATIWPDDKEAIGTLQELVGLLLTLDTRHQKLFLIVGPKRSGKGTIGRVIRALLGTANVAGPTLSSLAQNFGLQPLIGKPAAIISDARLSGRADAAVIAERLLSISGEDAITVDRKHVEPWTGTLPTRFTILTNELPRIADASGALASRFIVLTMTRSFYGKEDHGLTDSLLAELPGIFNWAVTGWRRLAERGHFLMPASSAEAMQDIEFLSSPILAFLRTTCVVEAGASVPCQELFDCWRSWCEAQGRDHPGTTQSFGRDLRAAVPGLAVRQSGPSGTRVRVYVGLRSVHACTRMHASSALHIARRVGEREDEEEELGCNGVVRVHARARADEDLIEEVLQ